MRAEKVEILMFVAALAIAFIAGSMVEFSTSYSSNGGIVSEGRQSLFFDSLYTSYPAYASILPASESQNISIGFDISPGEIDFGKLPGGSISRKFFQVSNPSDRNARIFIRKSGNISAMMKFSESEFLLAPGGSLNVSVSVNPEASDSGDYDGEVIIIYRQFRLSLLDFLS